jgi:hypothetical protein
MIDNTICNVRNLWKLKALLSVTQKRLKKNRDWRRSGKKIKLRMVPSPRMGLKAEKSPKGN